MFVARTIRFPVGLHERLVGVKGRNSLNREVVERLEVSFGLGPLPDVGRVVVVDGTPVPFVGGVVRGSEVRQPDDLIVREPVEWET